ncbi:MAG: O-antigen ligase family protein [Verrucomicrobiota bacterium]
MPDRPSLWRQYPWLLGLCLAPILYGSVTAEGKAVVGLLLGVSLLLLALDMEVAAPVVPKRWAWLCAVLLVLPLVPLPSPVVGLLNPKALELVREFPVEQGRAPSWLCLSVSPAGTAERLWEVLLLIACFGLARHAAALPGFARLFAMAIGATVFLLAASDVWYRLDGQRVILGIWQPSWGKGAGTFANRNHFANWMNVATLFAFGWLLRNYRPLHAARGASLPPECRSRVDVLFLVATFLFGLLMTVASGSRGGIAVLLVGGFVWLVLLVRRSRSRSRWLTMGVVVLVAGGVVLFTGEALIRRLAEAEMDFTTTYPKADIWKQSLAIFLKFPVFGCGLGTFVATYGHFKQAGGEATFWHAENDYVQLLMETGTVGVIAFGGLLFLLGRAGWLTAWDRAHRHAEPELVLGAVAALTGFAAHAVFEFVGQITSTALLAAALLGFVIGCRDHIKRAAVPAPPGNWRVIGNRLFGVALIVVAGLQAAAFWHWTQGRGDASSVSRAQVEEVRHSLQLAPWLVERQAALTRMEVRLLRDAPPETQREQAAAARAQLNRSIAWDPLNWELRLERAWLDLAFSSDRALGLAEAREVCRLNPRQPLIPLRFARHFAVRDPNAAWEFISQPVLTSGPRLREVLELAWTIRGDASALWSLVPDTPGAMLTFGEFAQSKRLTGLAAEAYRRAAGALPPAQMADRFLQIKRPELAVQAVPQPPASDADRLALARAWLQAGNPVKALDAAESVWRGRPASESMLKPVPVTETPVTLKRRLAMTPEDVKLARELAESIYESPAPKRDLATLRDLARRFPGELRIAWLQLQTEVELNDYPRAARTAMDLAARMMEQ